MGEIVILLQYQLRFHRLPKPCLQGRNTLLSLIPRSILYLVCALSSSQAPLPLDFRLGLASQRTGVRLGGAQW